MPIPFDTDTICAITTAPGRSGVGVVRISGGKVTDIANAILGFSPQARHAYYKDFLDHDKEVIDQGIAIYFQQPNSFTGEDVLELQGHGGVFVLNLLRDRCLSLGARIARPGEFSERAFLNDKMDLVQAEAIADLIDATSQQAARSAVRSLKGQFSNQIHAIVEKLIATRANVEAAIDFSDEDIDVLTETNVNDMLASIATDLEHTLGSAKQGALLKTGLNVVIAGRPNAGKSSVMNALSGLDSAIVTDVPGTTRDVLSEQITIDGMPVNIFDTAGLRNTDNVVEQEGVKRAHTAIQEADQILLVVDKSQADETVGNLLNSLGLNKTEVVNEKSAKENSTDLQSLLSRTTIVYNKIDLLPDEPVALSHYLYDGFEIPALNLSAKMSLGIELIEQQLKSIAGFNASEENAFVSRERHLQALLKAADLVNSAQRQIEQAAPIELAAEDLRLAQNELGCITGEFTSDDLLGEIFSTFCVGK